MVIYSFTSSPKNAFGHSSGYGNHIIKQLYNYRGKTLTFTFSSTYTMTNASFDNIYVGDYLELYLQMLIIDIIPILISISTFLIGIILILFWIIGHKKTKASNSILYLGIFSINIAIWNLNEISVIIFHEGNHIFSSYLSFVSLMFLPIPLFLFIREFAYNKNHIFWQIALISNLSAIFLLILFQMCSILDFKNTLPVIHALFIFGFAGIISLTLYDVYKKRISKVNKINIIFMLFVLVGFILDLFTFYFRDSMQSSRIGNLILLIYIIFIGVYEINHTSTLVLEGVNSKEYKLLAYTDNLTGLSNRTAMKKYLDEADYHNSYIIAMFDLNNLKKCNDTYGHNEGDRYIKICGSLIANSFSDIGKCFRIGGDEFCVIACNSSINKYNKCIKNLLKDLDAVNSTNEYKVELSIAYGYAEYSKDLDKNLTETRARADAEMYKCKYHFKYNQAQ